MSVPTEHGSAPPRRAGATPKPAAASGGARTRGRAPAGPGEMDFQRLAEGSDDVLWLADLTRQRLLYVNPRFEQLWGVSADALLADPGHWRRAVEPEDASLLPEPFFAAAADEPAVREYRIAARDGTQRWIRDRRFALRDEAGRVSHVGGIAEDVTERKQREMEREQGLQRERAARAEAEALAEAKDEFLAVVTHELRSPLNAIRGWAHVLRRGGSLSEMQRKALDAIDRNTQAQARLVDDLLDSQRVLCGDLRLAIGEVPLGTLLDEALEQVRPAAHLKRISLEVEHDASIDALQVDALRLCQALVKLLANAVKFTPEEGVVQVRSVRRGSGMAIEVKDSGIGLDAGQLRAVFHRFGQADSSRARTHSGLGLGLSLAQQLVDLHGGHIDVHSDGIGLGATFSIELPAAAIADTAAAPHSALATDGASPLAGKRVVVVEDDDDAREVLELILREAQAEPHSFDRASHAYKYLAQADVRERPDALISDIAMPDEDGYAFLRRVRELEAREGRGHVVALALTAFARSEDRARALAAGFDAHAAKPIDSERVVSTLAQAIDAVHGSEQQLGR
ncbi:MAG: hybrid sensor histidine kinase/response regulator [Betaproteobacteria bacterium]|nr:MAG: hybrid sensor histidine kinase/response regulator [Betaproteobacteria bacterium]